MKANGLWQRISTIILAILMVVPFSFIKAKANTYNANYSLTQYNYYVEKQGTNWATTDIFVNFKAPASGTLTINISPTLSSTYYSFVVISGGNLASSPTTSTTKLTIGVRSQQTVQVRVQSISTQSNAHATYTMSFSGTYEDGEALSLENIEAELVTLNGKIDTTNNVLAQINTKLANLSIQDYSTILYTINTSIGNVQSTIEDLPDYTSVLNSINTYLGSINTNVSDIETICSGIQTSINNILSTLQNIDNLIDTISWSTYTSASMPYSLDLNTWSTESNNNLGQSVYIDITSIIHSYHIYFISLPNRLNQPGLYGQEPYVQFFIQNSSTNYVEQPCEYYFVNQGSISYIVINLHGFASSNTNFKSVLKFTVQSPYSFYYRDQGGWKAISYNDIEYWKISSVLQEHMLLSNNASQQAISDQSSANDQFNYQSNQYHSVESTFQSNFETAFEAINPGEFTVAINQFASAFAWFTNQLGALYDSSGYFKILFTLPLILGITMFLLGRGAAIFSDPMVVRDNAIDRYNEIDNYREVWTSQRYQLSRKGRAFGSKKYDRFIGKK